MCYPLTRHKSQITLSSGTTADGFDALMTKHSKRSFEHFIVTSDMALIAAGSQNGQRVLRQHGVKGAYVGGDWVEIEDCVTQFNIKGASHETNKCGGDCSVCPRSRPECGGQGHV